MNEYFFDNFKTYFKWAMNSYQNNTAYYNKSILIKRKEATLYPKLTEGSKNNLKILPSGKW